MTDQDITARLRYLSDPNNAEPVGKLWDAMEAAADELDRRDAEIERLQDVLKVIADPNNVRLDAGARSVAQELQKVARDALEQKLDKS